MRRFLLVLLVSGVMSGCAHGPSFTPTRELGFISSQLNNDRYYVYIPKHWNPMRELPVLVYLHGPDERGSDGTRPTQTGLGPIVAKSQGTFPYIVVFPQAPRKTEWGTPENNKRVVDILEDVVRRSRGDPLRVFLTSRIAKSHGAWALGDAEAPRFAAVVPVGARAAASEVASKLSAVPVWVADYAAPKQDPWATAFADAKLSAWLAEQHRNEVFIDEKDYREKKKPIEVQHGWTY